MQPVTLEGNLVRLEPMGVEHVDALWDAGRYPGLWHWTQYAIGTPQDMRRYVEDALSVREAGTSMPFVTIWRKGDRVIGSTRFAAYEPLHRRVEIGWTWISPRWQRTGANLEAKLLMLRYAFEDLGLLRVEFKTDALNNESREALSRIGAHEEGTMRSHMVTASHRVRDSVYFSIIADEWPEVERALSERLTRGGGRT